MKHKKLNEKIIFLFVYCFVMMKSIFIIGLIVLLCISIRKFDLALFKVLGTICLIIICRLLFTL